MITAFNYPKAIKAVNLQGLPSLLKQGHAFYNEVTGSGKSLAIYHEEPEIRQTIDIYLDRLNAHLKTVKSTAQSKVATVTSRTVATGKKRGLKGIEKDIALSFIKRYVELDGKTVSEAEVFELLSSIQKAILDKRISKTDPHAGTISHIQSQLIKLYKSMGKTAVVSIADVDKYKGLGIWPIVTNYIAGKAIEKAISSSVKVIKKEIKKEPIKKRRHVSGLGCTGVCTCPKPVQGYSGLGSILQQPIAQLPITVATAQLQPESNPGRMSVNQAIATKYDLLNLDGDWLNLIGEACKPTSFFIYGPGGSGKSTLTMKFANYMAGRGNKVLYIAGEQFGTPVFAKMLQRLHIMDTPNFVIVRDLRVENPVNYDIIVLDSKDSLGTELQDFVALRKQYPKQSYIVLSQATKDGNFTGSEKWRNEVDTMIICQNGIAYTNRDKNRWGGSAEMQIF